MKQGEEYSLQQGCVKWFRLQYPQYLLFGVPNEATFRNRPYFANIGTLTGVSDLICVLPNKVLFIEMKSKTGRQSIEQKNFQRHIQELGFSYYIVRDFDEFKSIIENNLKI